MVWRTVVVENPARLSTRNDQLSVALSGGDEELAVPIEDIATLVLAHAQISVTLPLLAKLSASDVATIVCDDHHTPCGILLPLGQHFRTTEILQLQVDAALPLKKRCWQTVIQQKIRNQAECLARHAREGVADLRGLVPKVGSGDVTNVEATAAQHYWPKLLGDPFKRRADTAVNAALNYGYAIIRSAVARGVCARGLHPALGMHHASKANAFNLADDLLEPFRPFVDHFIASRFIDPAQQFDAALRRELIGLANLEVVIANEHFVILRAIEIVASSYVESLRAADDRLLQLHSFVGGV